MSRSSYALGEARDEAAEITRLQQQAAVAFQAERDALIALGLPETGSVLDVGCGPGFFAAGLREARPQLVITGLDSDPRTLMRAAAQLPVERADAYALPFSAGTFDFVYARMMLRHVSDPARVVAEMHRVVRPGGTVAAADSDDGTLVVDPEPPGFAEVRAARHATHDRRGTDVFVGRRLHRLLRDQGLADVQVRPLMLSSSRIGAGAFAAIVMKAATEMVDEDLISVERVRHASDSIVRWGKRDDVCGVITAFVAGGRK